MHVSILTLFPEMFAGPLDHSILGRARAQGLLNVALVNIRDYGRGRHRTVDDSPFGGGPGMVMKADVLADALDGACAVLEEEPPPHVVYMTPQGAPFRQVDAERLARLDHLVLICGHYEGIDERFIQARVDEQISLGDFVLTGGELAAMAVVDAVTRLRPGVLGDQESATRDSFGDGLLEHPHYTRPARWQDAADGMQRDAPKVLLSGHHQAIEQWRRRASLLRTLIRRPELVELDGLTRAERRMVQGWLRSLREEPICPG